jgi:hypothetical protein
MIKLLPPIMPMKIRNDPAGSGEWLASRGWRLHKAIDLLCTPGQVVAAPCDTTIIRHGYAYYNCSDYKLVELEWPYGGIRLLYVDSDIDVGRWVRAGDPVGEAQDITRRYPGQGMKPHIHWEVYFHAGTVAFGKEGRPSLAYINPEVLL